jgi:hypothetical protein
MRLSCHCVLQISILIDTLSFVEDEGVGCGCRMPAASTCWRRGEAARDFPLLHLLHRICPPAPCPTPRHLGIAQPFPCTTCGRWCRPDCILVAVGCRLGALSLLGAEKQPVRHLSPKFAGLCPECKKSLSCLGWVALLHGFGCKFFLTNHWFR